MLLDRRLIQNFDWVLLILLIIIAGVSILNLYSATYPIREIGGAQIFKKQIYWFLIGFFVFFMMTTFNYSLLERMAFPGLFHFCYSACYRIGRWKSVIRVSKMACSGPHLFPAF